MNTSANKNRILDVGWKNAFRNAFSVPLNNMIYSTHNRIQNITVIIGQICPPNGKAMGRRRNNKMIDPFATPNARGTKDHSNSKTGKLKKCRAKIFVISRSEVSIASPDRK